MAKELSGRKIAILFARRVEQVELVEPRDAVTQAGAQVELLSIDTVDVQATNHDIESADNSRSIVPSARSRSTTMTR